MENITLLHTSSNLLNNTGNSLVSVPTLSLPPMSNEVNEVTPPCPPLPYGYDNVKTNDQLIQKATTRLRCRLLQQGLIDAKSKVSHLQVELDNLRIELSTTENVLSKFGDPDDRQLLALERRFNTHQQQLDLLFSSSTPESQQLPQLQENAITASTSFSSTLSRMSSIFSARQKPFKKTTTPTASASTSFGSGGLHEQQHSDSSMTNDTCSTTEYDNNDKDQQYIGSDLDAREKRMRRRQRVKQLRQEYQQRLRTYDPTWKDDTGGHQDWKSSLSINDNNNNNNNNNTYTSNEPTATIDPLPTSPAIPPEQQITPKKQQQQCPSSAEQTTNATGKKRHVVKQTPNTMKKPMMTSTKPIQPSKPTAAPCLCKRNKTITTNKADPIKIAASTPHSPTYHSKQPEMVLLETQKQPLSPPPPPHSAEKVEKDETTHRTPLLDAHVLPLLPSSTPTPLTNDDDPPRPSNVSDWLLKQREYHLEQQLQQHNMDDDEGSWMKKETLIDNHQFNTTIDIGNNNNSNGYLKPPPTQTKQSSSTFDDVLRYLDTMSDFGNDSGLQKDISHLLAPMYSNKNNNRTPSIYSSSSSTSSSIYSSLSWSTTRSQSYWSSLLTNQGGIVEKYCSRYLVDGVNKSLSWCKFLSVLSLALLISLGRGPDHMLSLDDLDYYYLDLMADQGEPLVYSYYL